MNNLTPVVKNLLIINVIFYLATLFFQNQGIDLGSILGAHYFDSPKFGIWQPITYMFMHGSIGHIFFNMFSLFMFGPILENHWGAKRFINFYLLTGLGALALQWGVQAFELYQLTGHVINQGNLPLDLFAQERYNPQLFSAVDSGKIASVYFSTMVGASGAIFGIMTAFAVLYPNMELYIMFLPVPVKAKYFITGYIVIELISGVSRVEGDSIAHFAHLGGALVGYILVKYWRNKTTYFDYYE
ncbi:rhomboid family intramembrane serine protease [Pedobacter sp. Du54]|uniref:rhomboid family intramembrane serine protease n=1 Tax=Pedobacter anseongensis TaxID=3133439 RepID=UPI0030A40698